jgi:pimeloyl-ACP methyl ester carboxylesterase
MPTLDARLASWVSGCVAWLDERMHFDAQGRTLDPLSWMVDRFTQFSTAALYDRASFGSRLCALTVGVLESQRVDLVVAHSFGGTIALRAAWQLAQGPQFRLITLGTASGPTVVRSQMFGAVPRSRGKIALAPSIARWQHYVSLTDGFVGQAMLPHGFDRVELARVATGAFVAPGRGHALSAYLAAPEVLQAIRAGMQPTAASMLSATAPS